MVGTFTWLMTMLIILSVAANRRNRTWTDAPRADGRRLASPSPLAWLVVVVAIAAAVAFVFGGGALYGLILVHRLAGGRGVPPIPLALAVFYGATAAGALLVWIVLRRDAAHRLRRKLERAWSAAVEAFVAPEPDEPKPKAVRVDRDFD